MSYEGPMIQAAKSILLVVSALFRVVDPIGGSPVFLLLTRDYAAETRRVLARRIAVNSFVLLIACFTIGSHALLFFGISLPVVQVGGGLIVISTGWAMLKQDKVGIISLVILAVAIPARYLFHLARAWRWIYVVGATTALYLNVFVLVAQAFMKVPALKALAPTQTEPPFLVAQLLVLVVYVGFTIFAAKKFHIEPARAI
jgi:hypothetical protein